MDIVTTNLLTSFVDKFEITNNDEAANFENFCNYSIIKNEFNNEFEYEDISTGKDYQGIDGIAIIVNNQYISSIDELEEIIEKTKQLEVLFVFIQSKTSPSFDGAQILNFINTTKDVFNKEPQFTQTEEVKNKYEIIQFLYTKSSLMKENPTLKLYYITTGKWKDDKSLNAQIKTKRQLEDLSCFNTVDIFPYGASEIQKSYKNTTKNVSAEFTFKEVSPLPSIDGVIESYVGCLSFSEFKKIITDDKGNIKNIFYDNVRDFLGENTINSSIKDDLENKHFSLFPLLNNGVTIVASKGKVVSVREFFIENYQIVNGCQTSHILFNNKDSEGIDDLYIPIKVIITDNEEIKNKITIATNSQTAIKEEELTAFSDFQKDLELYYESISTKDARDDKLHYERRTGQFSSEQDFPRTKIVTIKKQIKTFSSMFLDMPHWASGKYKKLYNEIKKHILKSEHNHSAYYVSALALYKLEKLIRSNEIDRKYNKVRLHILMMFRILTIGEVKKEEFNSKNFEKKCEKLSNILLNEKELLNSFHTILRLIDESDIDISNQRSLYTEATRDILKKICIDKINIQK